VCRSRGAEQRLVSAPLNRRNSGSLATRSHGFSRPFSRPARPSVQYENVSPPLPAGRGLPRPNYLLAKEVRTGMPTFETDRSREFLRRVAARRLDRGRFRSGKPHRMARSLPSSAVCKRSRYRAKSDLPKKHEAWPATCGSRVRSRASNRHYHPNILLSMIGTNDSNGNVDSPSSTNAIRQTDGRRHHSCARRPLRLWQRSFRS
jgi:hypothetical protein